LHLVGDLFEMKYFSLKSKNTGRDSKWSYTEVSFQRFML